MFFSLLPKRCGTIRKGGFPNSHNAAALPAQQASKRLLRHCAVYTPIHAAYGNALLLGKSSSPGCTTNTLKKYVPSITKASRSTSRSHAPQSKDVAKHVIQLAHYRYSPSAASLGMTASTHRFAPASDTLRAACHPERCEAREARAARAQGHASRFLYPIDRRSPPPTLLLVPALLPHTCPTPTQPRPLSIHMIRTSIPTDANTKKARRINLLAHKESV